MKRRDFLIGAMGVAAAGIVLPAPDNAMGVAAAGIVLPAPDNLLVAVGNPHETSPVFPSPPGPRFFPPGNYPLYPCDDWPSGERSWPAFAVTADELKALDFFVNKNLKEKGKI